MPAALLVASTRTHADTRETLRIYDVATALVASGWSVDVVVPRRSPLLEAAMPMPVRVHVARALPFTANPPDRPGLVRLLLGASAFICALRHVRGHDLAIGFGDGASTARLALCAAFESFPCVADLREIANRAHPSAGLFAAAARALERATLRRASAVVAADESLARSFTFPLDHARLSVLPDPHAELAADAPTLGEFTEGLMRVVAYVTRLKTKSTRSP